MDACLAAGACAALLAVMAVGAASAAAAPFTCQPNIANPTNLRSSGVAEQTGDLLLICTGGTATSLAGAIPAYDITILTDTPTTSRLLADPWAEPLVLLDEPPSGTGVACATADGVCTNHGNGIGDPSASNYYKRNGGQNFDVFQGKVGSSSVTFTKVPIDPPASGGMRVLRFTNIRVDATRAPAPSSAGQPAVKESITISGAGAPTVSNPLQTAAFVFQGSSFAALTPDGSGPLANPVALAGCADARKTQVATLSYSEGFAGAFKKRNVATTVDSPAATADQSGPGTPYSTETGFYDPTFVGNAARGDLSTAGLADSGTRLKATLSGVPAGARLFVDVHSAGGGQAIALATASETGAYSPVGGGSTMTEVPLAGGSGTVVWEVLDADPNAFEKVSFGIYVDYAAGTPTPGGTATVSGDLAPTSSSGAASSGPVPRFAATSSATSLFSMSACQAPPAPAQDTTPPTVQSAVASPQRFAVDPRGPGEIAVAARSKRRASRGTTFRYVLSEASRVTFTVRRRSLGRKSAGKCVKPTRGNRKKKRCARYTFAGRFALRSPAGVNSHHFTGRIGTKRLKPGTYRVSLVATDAAGNHSTPRSFSIKVVRK